MKCNRCNKCGKKVSNLVEHVRREHMGKISRESYEYLVSLGIKDLDLKLKEMGLKVVL